MGDRVYNFVVGPETATLPTATSPSASSDFMTKGYADTNYGLTVSGSRSSPTAITAGGGISAPTGQRTLAFITGSGGAVDVSANPQIAAGTTAGQELILVGRSDTNTVLLEDGTGLDLEGAWLGGASSVLRLTWDGTNWFETGRR